LRFGFQDNLFDNDFEHTTNKFKCADNANTGSKQRI
jgi:hypothetical protein